MARYSTGGIGRSIPAWAGETRLRGSSPRIHEVYPRVGGGNEADGRTTKPEYGLSPRGRGKHSSMRGWAASMRSIPAWAGETIWALFAPILAQVYPRVGGGNRAPPSG